MLEYLNYLFLNVDLALAISNKNIKIDLLSLQHVNSQTHELFSNSILFIQRQ